MRARGKDATNTLAVCALALAVATAVIAMAAVVALDDDPPADATASGVDELEPGEESGDDGAVADPNAVPQEIAAASAEAMSTVTSVEFRVECEGAPVYIDQFESIALNSLHGQFEVPARAQAELSVTIDGNLHTRLGAIAVDDEIWLSNPVTGDFETLPEGYDIDPSRFFDPEGGWQPLLAGLDDLVLVGIDDRGGDRYHLQGVASAELMDAVTAGIVDDQDVVVDLWVQPASYLVTVAEFDTSTPAGTVSWLVELDNYGDDFDIEPPDNVAADDGVTTGG